METTDATINPVQSLNGFNLSDLGQFTKEGTYSNAASPDVHLFYVGRDNVHGLLKYILSRAQTSIYLNMFGYDDDELNAILMQKAADPDVAMMVTLDRSQAGGVAEKLLISADEKQACFNTHFVIGESATHQISHTKGAVIDGRVAFEGSTNWSNSGEGTFVVKGNGQAGGPGYKAQNNTLAVIVDPDTCARFTAELISEHLTAQKQTPTT
jgi:hypothetical protein